MLLFRSEEHVRVWYKGQGIPMGESLALEQQWELARLWYADRMSPVWRRRTLEEAQAIFAGLGLTGDFWCVTGHAG